MAAAVRTFPATYSKAPILYHGPRKKPFSAGKAILASTAALTIVGGFIADKNRTTQANHSDALSISLGAFLGAASLYFLTRKTFDSTQDIQLSALLPSMFWAAQGISSTYNSDARNTPSISTDKKIWLDEKLVSMAMLSLAGIGYALENQQRD